MNTILLISEEFIKENSVIYDNVDPTVIRPSIFEAQQINLRYILPDTLYNDVFNQFEAYREYKNGGGTDPIENQVDARILNLVDNSKFMLLYWTIYNASYSLYTRITNKGVNTQNSNYSQDAEFNVLKEMRKDFKQKAENYTQLLIDFLSDNPTIYTEFASTSDCNTDGVAFSNPLYLGSSI